MKLYEDYPSAFSMDELLSLQSYKKRLDYASSHLQRISSGSARVVFRIDDQKVLKVAKNKKGLSQNKVESDYTIQDYFLSIVAKVFESDENNIFLEMELAKKVSPKKFKEVLGFSIEYLEEFLISEQLMIGVSEDLEFMYEDLWVADLLDLASSYDMPVPGDFSRVSSYGLVTRDGKESIVLIDFGLNTSVLNTHYGR